MKFETPRSKKASAKEGARLSERRSGRFGVMPDSQALEKTNGGRRSIRLSSRDEVSRRNDFVDCAPFFRGLGIEFVHVENSGTTIQYYSGNGLIGQVSERVLSLALADLGTYAETFRRINAQQPFVIGVGRVEDDSGRVLDLYAQALSERGIVAPVYGIDVRNREDVLLLIETLLCILETQVGEPAHAAT